MSLQFWEVVTAFYSLLNVAHDDKLTKQEAVSAMPTVIDAVLKHSDDRPDPAALARLASAHVDRLFRETDTDKDGIITPGDFAESYRVQLLRHMEEEVLYLDLRRSAAALSRWHAKRNEERAPDVAAMGKQLWSVLTALAPAPAPASAQADAAAAGEAASEAVGAIVPQSLLKEQLPEQQQQLQQQQQQQVGGGLTSFTASSAASVPTSPTPTPASATPASLLPPGLTVSNAAYFLATAPELEGGVLLTPRVRACLAIAFVTAAENAKPTCVSRSASSLGDSNEGESVVIPGAWGTYIARPGVTTEWINSLLFSPWPKPPSDASKGRSSPKGDKDEQAPEKSQVAPPTQTSVMTSAHLLTALARVYALLPPTPAPAPGSAPAPSLGSHSTGAGGGVVPQWRLQLLADVAAAAAWAQGGGDLNESRLCHGRGPGVPAPIVPAMTAGVPLGRTGAGPGPGAGAGAGVPIVRGGLSSRALYSSGGAGAGLPPAPSGGAGAGVGAGGGSSLRRSALMNRVIASASGAPRAPAPTPSPAAASAASTVGRLSPLPDSIGHPEEEDDEDDDN